jgi:hypothetical protein
MMRHLTTFALAGILGSLLMAGNAEACHKKKCVCAPVVCAPAPVICYQPAPCPRPVKVACAPKIKKCGGGGLCLRLSHRRAHRPVHRHPADRGHSPRPGQVDGHPPALTGPGSTNEALAGSRPVRLMRGAPIPA